MTTPDEPVTTKSLDKATLTAGLMTVSQVCRSIRGARGNDSLSPSSVTRWILCGCPSRGGERIKLAAVRVGGRWMIAPEALEAFFAALASTGVSPAAQSGQQKPRTPAQRREAGQRAARELERRGA